MSQDEKTKQEATLTRSELIHMLTDAVKIVAGKVTAQRLRENSQDKTRLAYIRALAQLATPILSALRDSQLEELERRIAAIEGERKNGSTGTTRSPEPLGTADPMPPAPETLNTNTLIEEA